MSKILLINSSPMADNSISRKLTASFVAKYQAAKGETFEVIEHDTVALNLPHADGDVLGLISHRQINAVRSNRRM